VLLGYWGLLGLLGEGVELELTSFMKALKKLLAKDHKSGALIIESAKIGA